MVIEDTINSVRGFVLYRSMMSVSIILLSVSLYMASMDSVDHSNADEVF